MNRAIQQGKGSMPIPEVSASRISLAELQRAVWFADPAAWLTLPRLLRRVIRQHCHSVIGLGLSVPHRKSYVLAREPLLEIVDAAELGCADQDALPEQVILLERPSQEELAAAPADVLLLHCWRLLFHARVHAALAAQISAGRLTPPALRQRIQRIGAVQFDEARLVLEQERYLLPPSDETGVYVELAAVYLELKYFLPSLLPRYFPSLGSVEVIDAVLAQDLDAAALFRATRPDGATPPQDAVQIGNVASRGRGEFFWDPAKWRWDAPPPAEALPVGPAPGSVSVAAAPAEVPADPKKYRALVRRAEKAAGRGNVVGAAICRARAERLASPKLAARARAAMRADIADLIRRLQAALGIADQSAAPWQQPLMDLLGQTPSGIWTAEARLLYDLQKVCVDHEREISTVDLVEWALSLGRRPLRRPLPHQREVLMSKHLRSAAGRLTVVRLSDRQRRALSDLLRVATQRAETGLRDRCRPLVAAALDDLELRPRNLPERVAKKKIVEELLDRIVERGFLTLGDLRDALSRNNLKQPDFSRPADLLHGDALLRSDQRLAVALDGVYQRGEFYLRWMQQFSSLAFGTRTGRFLTRYAAVPFGGAVLVLAGVEHLIELLGGGKVPLFNTPSVLLLGTLFLALLYIPWFRHGLALVITRSYTTLRSAVAGSVRWLVDLPLVQRFVHSRLARFVFRFVLKPLALTALVWAVTPLEKSNWQTSAGGASALFLGLNLFLNSRLGRTVEEVLRDWIVEGWQRFGLRLLTGLFWLIVDFFRFLLQTVERLLYAVDQWLRFKSGESRFTLVAKAVLGVAWFFVAYVTRFCINLLIEPQINPIKHFPVVTVAHKLLLPMIPTLASVLALTLEEGFAYVVATTIIFSIPGICGFLVWELKENWRLYAANRPGTLPATRIGQYGESMTRLLKPGLHSGALPKRYAKLRHAERQARSKGNWKAVRKHLQALYRIEVAMGRYVQREFLELFVQSGGWQIAPPVVGEIRLGANRIQIALECPGVSARPLWIAFDMKAGWLVAGTCGASWADELSPPQWRVLLTALVGLYQTAGVELVRQQIESAFSLPPPAYDFCPQGLVAWPDVSLRAEMLYDLRDGTPVTPQVVSGLPSRILPTLERERLRFSDLRIGWQQWVDAWGPAPKTQGVAAGASLVTGCWELGDLADTAMRR